MEYLLTERITQTLWRLRRIPTAEAELFNRHNESRRDQVRAANQRALSEHNGRYAYYSGKKKPAPPEPTPLPNDLPSSQTLANAFWNNDDKTNAYMRLTRYESHLQRSYHRDLKLLKQLQKDPPLPATQRGALACTAENPNLQNEPTESPKESLSSVLPDQPLPEDPISQIEKEQNEPKSPTTDKPQNEPNNHPCDSSGGNTCVGCTPPSTDSSLEISAAGAAG